MMSILLLVRNFVPAHEQIQADGWNVAQVARNAFDLEGKVVGTVGCGRIGYRVLQRLQPFQCKELLWFDYADLPTGKFSLCYHRSTSSPTTSRGGQDYKGSTSGEARRNGRAM